MRIKVIFNANGKKIPFINQHMLNGYIHKCIGKDNKFHDGFSDYCISMLCGGKMFDKESIIFEDKAFFTVTSSNEEFLSSVMIGIMGNPMFNGMPLDTITPMSEKFYNGKNYFATLSPILLKRKLDRGKYEFITGDNADYVSELKASIIRKLNSLSIEVPSDFDVIVESNIKKKSIMVKNVKNVGNLHLLTIIAPREIAETIYNIGIGNSTGSGFGTIYKTENVSQYRF